MKKFSVFIASCFCIALLNHGYCQPPASESTTQLIEKVEPGNNPLIIPYEKYRLSNGLILIVHEDHSEPVAYVRISYHVGSAREQLGKSGFAHFFEHMMFEGSNHV